MPAPQKASVHGPQRPRMSRRRNHRQEQLNVLTKWFNAHMDDPYPSPEEKFELARKSHMEVRQIEHWFTNRRKRKWNKPHGNPLAEEEEDDEIFS